MYKKRDLLNEIAGVPKVIEEWVELFTNTVIVKIEEALKNEGWSEESSGDVENRETGKLTPVTIYKTVTNFDGKNVMDTMVKLHGNSDLGEFVKSNTFKSLPIWRPAIELQIIGLPDWLYDVDFKGKSNVSAAMKQQHGVDKLGKIGKQPVIKGIDFRFDPHIPDSSVNGLSDDVKQSIKDSLKTTVAHELLHAYQVYKQLEGGGESHFGREMLLNAMTQHPNLKLHMFEEWSSFLNLVYLHLSFEINARVNELYYEMKKEGVTTTEEFLTELKKSHIWSEVQALESFDAKQFMKDFKLPSVGDDIFSQMIGKSLMDLQLKSMGVNPSTEETAMKSLIELWDTILQTGSQAMEKLHGVKVPMDKVPQSAKDNPYLFFKFFEKRFHKNAASFKKKLYRIASLLVNQEGVQSESIKKKVPTRTIGEKPRKFKLIESTDDFEWMGSMEDSQFDELKGEIFKKYPEIRFEEDFEHNILRITNAIYRDGDVITEKGFAFKIDRVIETMTQAALNKFKISFLKVPNKILYSVGEFTEIWRANQLGERGELVDSDLSFSSSVGSVDEVMGYLHHTSLGGDGRPYED